MLVPSIEALTLLWPLRAVATALKMNGMKVSLVPSFLKKPSWARKRALLIFDMSMWNSVVTCAEVAFE